MTVLSIAILFVLFVGLPWQSARTHQSGLLLTVPRAAVYQSVVVSQWLVLLLACGAVWLERVERNWRGLAGDGVAFRRWLSIPTHTLRWCSLLLVGAIGVYAVFLLMRKLTGQRESETVYRLVPRSLRERQFFAVAVAPTAGIVEEFLFRGLAITYLLPLVQNPWIAAVVSSVAFALGHVYQGALGASRAGTLGFLLAIPFVYTGSLMPSIIVHALIDVVAGVVLPRWLIGDAPKPLTELKQLSV